MLVVECGQDRCAEIPVGLTGVLTSVWASEDGEVIATGSDLSEPAPGNSVVLRYLKETESWETLASVGKVFLQELSGDSSSDLWGAGTDWGGDKPIGVVQHFDGSRWTRESETPGIPFWAISGSNLGLFAGGYYYYPDESGRLGMLLRRNGALWEDTGLDMSYGILSLHAEESRLLAGVIRVIQPTREYVFEWVDLTEPDKPKTLCTDPDALEDMVRLGDGTIVAIGRDNGAIYFAPGQ
jgi:hypothetical protein